MFVFFLNEIKGEKFIKSTLHIKSEQVKKEYPVEIVK